VIAFCSLAHSVLTVGNNYHYKGKAGGRGEDVMMLHLSIQGANPLENGVMRNFDLELPANPTLRELRVSAETLGWIGKRNGVFR
jgi:hypothetical protein